MVSHVLVSEMNEMDRKTWTLRTGAGRFQDGDILLQNIYYAMLQDVLRRVERMERGYIDALQTSEPLTQWAITANY